MSMGLRWFAGWGGGRAELGGCYRVSWSRSSGVSGMPSVPGEKRSKESGCLVPGER